MTLEQALADNTAAVKALTAALAGINFIHDRDLEDCGTGTPQPPAPPMQPVTAAPSTAAAAPAPTALAASTDSFPPPTSVFGQAALPSAAQVTPVAPLTTIPAAPGNVTPGVPPAGMPPRTDLDVKGLPWDGRIHAGTKTKNADGSWKKKRGVEEAAVANVEAELRAAMAGAPVAPAAPVSGLAGQPWPFAEPSAPGMSVATFQTLTQLLPGAMTSGKVTSAQVEAACLQVGVPNLPMLAHRPDLVPQVMQMLGLSV